VPQQPTTTTTTTTQMIMLVKERLLSLQIAIIKDQKTQAKSRCSCSEQELNFFSSPLWI
jgi:hypothetical protein